MIKDIQDKILARSVHGGSTGLEQQKAKRYPQKLKPAEFKYPFIKEEVKKNHDIDLVFITLHGGEGEDGTLQLFLEKNNIKVTSISDITGMSSVMDGRVKTLDPKIFGSILIVFS